VPGQAAEEDVVEEGPGDALGHAARVAVRQHDDAEPRARNRR
jgi:hypothetical protein